MNKVSVLDTTLRDGAQSQGVQFSQADRVAVSRLLDELGVDYIEAGNPHSSPADAAFFANPPALSHSRLTAFGATCRKDTRPEDDAGIAALLAAGTETIAIFGKCWLLHVSDVLGCSAAENLSMIERSAAFLRERGREVIFDAEHFFDGYAENPEYALDVLRAAARGGASILTLCDTRGGRLPDEISRAVGAAVPLFSQIIGIHSHDDCGMADANSVMAVLSGARHVQGTMGELGERCGNASLPSVIPSLQLKRSFFLLPDSSLSRLTHAARAVADIANLSVPAGAPYVGMNAFAHKAGMHVDAVMKNSVTFEHVPPESVGNSRRFITSDMAGRSLVLPWVQKLRPDIRRNSPEVAALLADLKEREADGFSYEAADASFELLVRRHMGMHTPHFELLQMKTISEQPIRDDQTATAIIKVRVGGSEELSAGQGDGPVHALDRALRRALEVFYPEVGDMRLTDYKVRVLNPREGTAARVRVLITSVAGAEQWTTVGVSSDIITASWQALSDSIEYKLIQRA